MIERTGFEYYYILCCTVLMHFLITSIGAISNLHLRKLRLRETNEIAQGDTSNNNDKEDLPSTT